MNYRKSIVLSIALTLLLAGPVTIGPSRVAGDGATTRATGAFTTVFPAEIARATQGDLDIMARFSVTTFTGSLDGTTLSVQTVARDDVVKKKAFQTNTGSFWGTLDDSKPGSFSFIIHLVTDRPFCERGKPCAGPNPISGNLVVVEGTGMDGLEGICGGGTFHMSSTGVGTDYDFTFRFGKDCKANDR